MTVLEDSENGWKEDKVGLSLGWFSRDKEWKFKKKKHNLSQKEKEHDNIQSDLL